MKFIHMGKYRVLENEAIYERLMIKVVSEWVRFLPAGTALFFILILLFWRCGVRM
jgi:hypothetical protein